VRTGEFNTDVVSRVHIELGGNIKLPVPPVSRVPKAKK
jgi:hypothetical protein